MKKIKQKYLQVTMPDNTIWEVPVILIAENRAKYYAAKEDKDDFEEIFNEELRYCLERDYEIMDWAANETDWADIEKHAVKVENKDKKIKIDYQEGWVNGEQEIVEH